MFMKHDIKQPAVASAMTWSSTYVLLVLLIQPKHNLTGLDRIAGSLERALSKGVLMCIATQNSCVQTLDSVS